MQPGAVIVDVAIDRRDASRRFMRRRTTTPSTRSTGSFTTVSRTCRAACRARRHSRSRTRPSRYVMQLAKKGWKKALRENEPLAKGLERRWTARSCTRPWRTHSGCRSRNRRVISRRDAGSVMLPPVLCYHKVERRHELGVTRISPSDSRSKSSGSRGRGVEDFSVE